MELTRTGIILCTQHYEACVEWLCCKRDEGVKESAKGLAL